MQGTTKDVVNIYVEGCIKSLASEGINNIAKYGGRVYPLGSAVPNNFTYNLSSGIVSPSLENLQSELSYYISSNLLFCVRNFKTFNEKEITIDAGAINASSKITLNKAIINVLWLLNITQGSKIETVDSYSVEIISSVGKLYTIAARITLLQHENNGSICLTCLADLADQNNIRINMFDYGKELMIFTITNEADRKNIEDFEFGLPFSAVNDTG